MLEKIRWFGILTVAVAYPTFVAPSSANAPTQPAQNSVEQQLVGRWEGRIDKLDVPIGMRFSPLGKLVSVFEVGFDSSERMAFVVNYSINPNSKPMHLDLQLDQPASATDRQKPVFTIFELLNARTLRLHIKNLEPGKPRPTRFDQPAQLIKVSDSAIVFPESAQLSAAERSQDGEGGLVMRNLALSALYYNLEMQQFPTALNQLGLSNTVTANYGYQLQTKSNQLTLIARPKKDNLKSYTAVVLRFPIQGQDYSTTRVCESIRPSRIAPPMPKISNSDTTLLGTHSIQCGSGSKAIEF